MKFGEALDALEAGKKVARGGWNGKGMFLVRATDITFATLSDDTVSIGEIEYPVMDSIAMKTADNSWVVGWLASQTDMQASDWVIVE